MEFDKCGSKVQNITNVQGRGDGKEERITNGALAKEVESDETKLKLPKRQ
jgi:hypothetical protein